MRIIVPVSEGIAMGIGSSGRGPAGYPTAALGKGLLLLHDGQELAEEGVGFGVPILKRGVRTFFPGLVTLTAGPAVPCQEVTAVFRVNLEEKLAAGRRPAVHNRLLYAAKNRLAAMHRGVPLLRGLLTAASSGLRSAFGWRTTFEEAELGAQVTVRYSVLGNDGELDVEVDLSSLPRGVYSELVVMNEQGARCFCEYRDSAGTSLSGRQVGSWDEVTAGEASFLSAAHRLAFSLRQVKGARLFRGRELIGSRLSWAGFGYSLRPSRKAFRYTVRVGRVP